MGIVHPRSTSKQIIPNTAVFGSTNLLTTTTTTTTTARKRMTEKGFLRWPDGAIRKILFIYSFIFYLFYSIFN